MALAASGGGKRRAAPAREQAEPVVQTRGELLDRNRPQAGGRQLDRQRDAIESLACLGHGCCVRAGQSEARPVQTRALDEQADRLG